MLKLKTKDMFIINRKQRQSTEQCSLEGQKGGLRDNAVMHCACYFHKNPNISSENISHDRREQRM